MVNKRNRIQMFSKVVDSDEYMESLGKVLEICERVEWSVAKPEVEGAVEQRVHEARDLVLDELYYAIIYEVVNEYEADSGVGIGEEGALHELTDMMDSLLSEYRMFTHLLIGEEISIVDLYEALYKQASDLVREVVINKIDDEIYKSTKDFNEKYIEEDTGVLSNIFIK